MPKTKNHETDQERETEYHYRVTPPNWVAFDQRSEPTLQLSRCSMYDEPALSLWINARLHGDYFFRRGQLRDILSSPLYAVYAASFPFDGPPELHDIVAFVITHRHSQLLNMYIDAEWRGKNLGRRILEVLAPAIVRSKTDQSTGDPTEFYRRCGYEVIAEKQGANGNINILALPGSLLEH